jgi:hypothetical protein
MKLKVNMNAPVKVVLTKYGRETLKKHEDELRLAPKMRYRVGKDGVFESQLWELFLIFGPGTFLGMGRVPFVDNEVEFQ